MQFRFLSPRYSAFFLTAFCFFAAVAFAEAGNEKGLSGKVINHDGKSNSTVETFVETLPSGRIRIVSVLEGDGAAPKLSSKVCGEIGETGAERSDGVISCTEFPVYPDLNKAKENPLPRAVKGADGSYLFQEMTTWGPVNQRLMVTPLGFEMQTVTDVQRAWEFMGQSGKVGVLPPVEGHSAE